MTTLPQRRRTYYGNIALQIVRFSGNADESYPNFADGSSRSSVVISNGIAETLGFPMRSESKLSGQAAGSLFRKTDVRLPGHYGLSPPHAVPGKKSVN